VYLNTAGGSASAFACRLVKGDRMRDLAAFRIGAAALPPGNDCLPRARFAGPGAVHRGRRILFLGFPLNYGMQADPEGGGLRKLPIARTGIIASEPGVDEFLIDAMVSNGNSGSPVFVRAGKGRRAAPGYRLAGIMKEFQHDTIPLRRDDGSARKIPHNTGLAAVIPADAIAAFLENLPGVP
jgi:S1-C subfamily serine protease